MLVHAVANEKWIFLFVLIVYCNNNYKMYSGSYTEDKTPYHFNKNMSEE